MNKAYTPEERLMTAIFGERKPTYDLLFCYPIVFMNEQDDGKRAYIMLSEAIQQALDKLPLTQSGNDSQDWSRHKRVLELYFGLTDGKSKSIREVGQELGGLSGSQIARLRRDALRRLRYFSEPNLRLFLIPLPEEIAELRNKLCVLSQRSSLYERSSKRISEVACEHGASEEEIAGTKPAKISAADKAAEDNYVVFINLLTGLSSEFPNAAAWNALRRGLGRNPPTTLAMLKKLVESGEVLKLRGFGKKSERFLKKILQIAD